VLRQSPRYTPLLIMLVVLSTGADLSAARPSEELLPTTTKALVVVPDMKELRERFDATQLGALAKDPVMQPFVEDLKRQLRAKLNKTGGTLGLSWEDLEKVYGGEVAIAALQPWDHAREQAAIKEAVARDIARARADGAGAAQLMKIAENSQASAREAQIKLRREQHAIVALVDVTGHLEEAAQLLARVGDDFKKRGAVQGTLNIDGLVMTSYTLPRVEAGKAPQLAFMGILGDRMIATDDADVARDIVGRIRQPSDDSLASLPAFATSLTRCREAFGGEQPHIRWFVEPFGYVDVSRAIEGGPRRRGTDMLRVLENQGFSAIKGLGGFVQFDMGDCELLHRTFVYAPPVANSDSGSRYELAANMLDFPNGGSLQPQNWIPRDLAMYTSFNWRTQEAFYAARTLVDEIAGGEVFEEVLQSFATDENGPRVDIKKELVAHLGERATMISDYRLPVSPESERLLFAVEVTNEVEVARTVNKAMQADPAAKRRVVGDLVVWEILNEDPADVPELEISGNGFGFDGFSETVVTEEDKEKPIIPNSAVTVAFGHLIVASHVDYIVDVLEHRVPADRLTSTHDYVAMQAMLARLGTGEGSFRVFTRTDEAYRVTYELFRQGKMPESESMLGKLLNRIWEPAEEGVVREPRLEGDKLPDFQVVRRYLGPAGIDIQTEDDGWTVVGCLLTKRGD